MQRILGGWKSTSFCCLVGTAACTLLLLVANTAAFGQDGPIADNSPTADKEDLQPSFSEMAVDRPGEATCSDLGCWWPCCRPRWTASADCIILDRIGSVSYTLVATAKHSIPFKDLYNITGTEVLNANDLEQGFAAGPKLGLIRHGDNGYDLELSYFQIDGWNDYRSIGPTPDDWLIMRASRWSEHLSASSRPQRDANDGLGLCFRLYNAELNMRWNACARLTVLVGFRWANLTEGLLGTLPDAGNLASEAGAFLECKRGEQPLWFPGWRRWKGIGTRSLFDRRRDEGRAFWQQRGRDNGGQHRSDRLLGVGFDQPRRLSWRNRLAVQVSSHAEAFAEAGLRSHLAARRCFGAGQIQETYSYSPDRKQTYIQALGVNCGSGVFYHGATAGLEYSF